MQREDHFDLPAPNDIRIKGHRIGIETMLYDYLHRGRSLEEIITSYPSRSLDEVRATIRYYEENREAVDQYMAEWQEFGRRMREEQQRNPPPVVARLHQLKAERAATKLES